MQIKPACAEFLYFVLNLECVYRQSHLLTSFSLQSSCAINARVRLEPEDLETIVRESLDKVSKKMAVNSGIDDLQCFSPAYPEPAHVIREPVE